MCSSQTAMQYRSVGVCLDMADNIVIIYPCRAKFICRNFHLTIFDTRDSNRCRINRCPGCLSSYAFLPFFANQPGLTGRKLVEYGIGVKTIPHLKKYYPHLASVKLWIAIYIYKLQPNTNQPITKYNWQQQIPLLYLILASAEYGASFPKGFSLQ